MIAVREDSRSGDIADVGTEQACWRRCTDVHRCCARDDDASPNTLSACMGVYFRRGSSAEADLRKKLARRASGKGPRTHPSVQRQVRFPLGSSMLKFTRWTCFFALFKPSLASDLQVATSENIEGRGQRRRQTSSSANTLTVQEARLFTKAVETRETYI